jgi:hypothetical protein
MLKEYIGDGDERDPQYSETLFGRYREFIKHSGGDARKNRISLEID